MNKLKIEDLKPLLYQLDWLRIFRDAYESRKTSWVKVGHIREWRNATDEVCSAVIKQLEEKLKEVKKKNE